MLKRLMLGLVTVLLLCACAGQGPDLRAVTLSDTPLYGKFVWHDLITDDVPAAKAFYGSLFGWSFEDTSGPAGNDYVLIRGADGAYVGGMVELEDPQTGADYSRWLAYLSVPDVDQASAATEAAGGQVLLPPRDLGQLARAAAVSDAQGAVLGLVRSAVGDPVDTGYTKPGFVAWNELLTSDVAAAAAFYTALAGFEQRLVERYSGQYLMLEAHGRVRAGIQPLPADSVKPLWLTHFGVNDIAALSSRAAKLGGTVLVSPSPEVRSGGMALVTDPTGAIFGLQRLP